MTFNAELAQQIAFEDIPRDDARYFEGRAKEIEEFKFSLNASTRRAQAVFRIYQGAPGCGKTSLAAYLAKINPDTVFIKLSDRHLTDFASMMERIKSAASRQEGRYAVTATHWTAVAIERLAGRALTEELQKAAQEHSTDGLRFALHVDEAHSLKNNALDVLKELHVGGLGEADQIPCVVVLTGLGHAKEHINRHPGLTRSGDSTTINMTAMTSQECADSTMRMLTELEPDEGSVAVRQSLSDLAAEAAFGWPRHLQSAQKSICEALIEANGSALALDHNQIKARCAELRAEYYEERMKDIIAPGGDDELAQQIIAQLPKQAVRASDWQLDEFCEQVVRKLWLSDKPIPDIEKTRESFKENGIVERKDGVWALSIPSMAAWAAQQLTGIR
ncbi:MAG: ATP-binding protein [Gammaproteobacteria bacterium]|nr:ATP-binding protein [Gammaproteobacteria bacterium]MDE0270379.1 ATP-binding protein [Gammaproteobacteria bacterium]